MGLWNQYRIIFYFISKAFPRSLWNRIYEGSMRGFLILKFSQYVNYFEPLWLCIVVFFLHLYV